MNNCITVCMKLLTVSIMYAIIDKMSHNMYCEKLQGVEHKLENKFVFYSFNYANPRTR